MGYLVSLKLGIVNTSLISERRYYQYQTLHYLDLTFHQVAVIAPLVLAVLMEHVGDITTNGQVVSKKFYRRSQD